MDVKNIIEIGNELDLNKIDINIYLPNYPIPRGSELIFSSNKLLVDFLKVEELEFLIKGLHYIELKYRELQENEFGFGSPSQTINLIKQLKKRNLIRGLELEAWVSKNGGNYYIKNSNNKIIND